MKYRIPGTKRRGQTAMINPMDMTDVSRKITVKGNIRMGIS
jgi:hypothetical protein